MSNGDSRDAGGDRGLYYGWVIVLVMATAGAVSMAMGSLNFGLFIKPMGDSLGIGASVVRVGADDTADFERADQPARGLAHRPLRFAGDAAGRGDCYRVRDDWAIFHE